MKDLTPRQSEVLNWIKRFIATNQYPPTRSEIATGLGFKSPNAAQEHLLALEAKHAIRLTSGAARGIAILGGVSSPSLEKRSSY
jgi:repressor LexA